MLSPYSSFSEKKEMLKRGVLDLSENIEEFLLSIQNEKEINAYNSVFSEEALGKATEIKEKITKGTEGKLAGMVISVKDVLSLINKPMTASSSILGNFIAEYSATVIGKLENEDAIIIGKTNCDEFAMGSTNESSAFGFVRNPLNKEFVPGGSSGGSAAAVAANLCDVSLGTDTGGSIRQPASFCGVYGLKPTYSLVSRYGLTSYASSFDTIGPIANNISDIAIVLDVIAGHDPKDSTSSKIEKINFSDIEPINKNLRIGLPREYLSEGLDPEIRDSLNNYLDKVREKGFSVEFISLPHTEYSVSVYYILTTAEASSNLSRYDGVRYGFRSLSHSNLDEMYTTSRTLGFGDEVKLRIMLGTYVLSSGYFDAYYKKAQKVRRLIKNDFDNAFQNVDLIIAPTTPHIGQKIGEKSENPLQMYLGDIYTTSANLAGIPALNIPVGFAKNGLPVGIQVMANRFNDKLLISFGKEME
ncbi:MAG: Asp-tRNA(Asn)/Glu-tRNA(Gln) amidotransferase subunit GatA [Ignavibacteriaceae bacterium]